MATIEVSIEQLLRAVEQIPEQDLDSFIAQVLVVRAQRTAPHLSADETALLMQINAALSPAIQQRYDALIAKRRGETLLPNEQQELLELSDLIEQHDANRIAAMAKLAQLRQISLPQLMQSLGIE